MPDAAVSVPLFGTGIATKSTNLSAQMRTNLYVEGLKEPDKAPFGLFARPGLLLTGDTGAFAQARGAIGYFYDDSGTPGLEGKAAFAAFAAGIGYVSVYDDGSVANGGSGPGSFATTSGPVRSAVLGTSFQQFQSQALSVDGVGALWSLSSGSGLEPVSLSTLPSAAAFPFGSNSVTACASRFVAVDPSALGRFRWSAPGDGSTWNALDFATAESSPDPLVAVFEAWGELMLFGSQTIEFWAPAAAGASGQLPFVRIGGANIQWGTDAIDSIVKCGNQVAFLGRSEGGNRQVVTLYSYFSQVISTPDVEYDIEQEPSPSAVTAFFVVSAGHSFYVLNLTNTSWAYDFTTGTWGKWETDGARFAGQYAVATNRGVLLSDYRNSQLYYLDPTTYTDGGATLTREVVTRHIFEDLARMSLKELAIDCETGVGLDGSQQGTAPQLMLQWSKDGGHAWGAEVWNSLGAIGQYLTRAVWRGLGRSRDWLFRVRVTDPVKVVIIGAAAIFSP